MKSILICFIFPLFFLSTSTALGNEFKRKVSTLVEKGYYFYGIKDDEIKILTGTGKIRRISYSEFVDKKLFLKQQLGVEKADLQTEVAIHIQDGYQLVIRKKHRFFILEGNRFSRYFPEKDYLRFQTAQISSKTEEIQQRMQCAFCQFKVSGNYITTTAGSQYSLELSWLPYWRINQNLGIGYSLSVSNYYLTNEKNDDLLSYGLKNQVLVKGFLGLGFIEVGGGTHYFTEFQENSGISTIGIGKTFQDKFYLISDSLNINSVYFHYSEVYWTTKIEEFKLGIGFSF